MAVRLDKLGGYNVLSLSATRMNIELRKFRDKKEKIDPRVSQHFTNNLNMDSYERIYKQESNYEEVKNLERCTLVDRFLKEFLGENSDLDTRMGFVRRYTSRIEFLQQYPERVAETYNLDEMIEFLERFGDYCNRKHDELSSVV